jgi:nucleotide-binding universal stress UspA family protein
VHATLVREFSKRLQSVMTPVRLRLEPHLGRLGDRLADLAAEEQSDLIVVGSHDRNLAERILHGSVSHDVVNAARASVVCVPPAVDDINPTLDSVLVATDLGPVGNAAIRLAYAAVAPHGTVHLVHVVPNAFGSSVELHDIFAHPTGADGDVEPEARRQLIALLPKYVSDPRPSTRVHVLCSNHPAEAICQAAERLDVSLICLGTHGRSGLPRALLGSVAASVLETTARPVLLSRGARD